MKKNEIEDVAAWVVLRGRVRAWIKGGAPGKRVAVVAMALATVASCSLISRGEDSDSEETSASRSDREDAASSRRGSKDGSRKSVRGTSSVTPGEEMGPKTVFGAAGSDVVPTPDGAVLEQSEGDVKTAEEAAKDKGPACDKGELLTTMSTRWAQPEDKGGTLELKNRSARTVFLRMTDPTSGALRTTILIKPGTDIREPMPAGPNAVEIQTGSKWCNRQSGWEDGKSSFLTWPLEVREGTSTIVITSKAGEQPTLTRMPSPKVARTATGQAGTAVAGHGGITPEEPKTKILRLEPRERALAGLERGGKRMEAMSPDRVWAEELAKQLKGIAAEVPVTVSGGRNVVSGRLGGQEVQFSVETNGLTAISEAMATQAGALGCVRGFWRVSGLQWNTCKRVLPVAEFGGVSLKNVPVVVVPGNHRPVLGYDIVGPGKVKKGPDGAYMLLGGA